MRYSPAAFLRGMTMAANTDLRRLQSIGQGNVLRFSDQLDDAGRRRLTAQLEALDIDNLAKLIEQYVKHRPEVKLPSAIRPVQALPHTPDAARRKLYEDAQVKGRELLTQGKIAAF